MKSFGPIPEGDDRFRHNYGAISKIDVDMVYSHLEPYVKAVAWFNIDGDNPVLESIKTDLEFDTKARMYVISKIDTDLFESGVLKIAARDNPSEVIVGIEEDTCSVLPGIVRIGIPLRLVDAILAYPGDCKKLDNDPARKWFDFYPEPEDTLRFGEFRMKNAIIKTLRKWAGV